MLRRTWTAILALCSIGGLASAQGTPRESGTLARHRGLRVVGPDVAWASGSDATCLRTTDGGATWIRPPMPESSGLNFRDVQAIDADTAHLLSIGEGPRSSFYRTTDGGTSWTLTYLNRDPSGFLDTSAFCDADQAFEVVDVAEAVAELRGRGMAVEPVRIDEQAVKRFTFFADANGLTLELDER